MSTMNNSMTTEQEALVKRLRKYANWAWEDCDCASCIQCRNTGMMCEAADAFEVLSERQASLERALTRFIQIIDDCEGFDPDVEQMLMDHVEECRALSPTRTGQ